MYVYSGQTLESSYPIYNQTKNQLNFSINKWSYPIFNYTRKKRMLNTMNQHCMKSHSKLMVNGHFLISYFIFLFNYKARDNTNNKSQFTM